jgi:HSP20 family protein
MKFRSLIPWREHNELEWAENHPFYGLQRDLNRMFNEFWRDSDFPVPGREGYAFTPRVDIVEVNGNFEVTAELPGMEAKDVELAVTKDMLTIKGEKKQEKEETKDSYYRMERSYGTFARSIPLPANLIDENKVEADFHNGILKITLPKLPEVKAQTRQIPIKTA